ncbi:MAG: hypothetical protein JO227_00660 [Acetobacteraceae bacterium]|nr:hypothetical protein [Acetobacteraceae bacterium]
MLERDGSAVGILLMIHSFIPGSAETRIRCSVSNWYVEPALSSYGALLVSQALKHRDVTYVNSTPAAHTWPILEAQGYVRHCDGVFVALPSLFQASDKARIQIVSSTSEYDGDIAPHDRDLLVAHADYGCLSVVCHAPDGAHPFVFLPRKKAGLLPFAYLAYCRDREDFVRFSGPLGRFLARLGYAIVVLDSNGSIAGLVGHYVNNRPKYFKGPDRPRLGDLAYSELALFVG